MLGISGGIEPIFSLSYTRKTESLHGEDVYYKVFTPIADRYMKKHGLTKEEELPNFFVTAQTLNPFKRVEMQGVWQSHIDASISSTINLPNKATVEEVEQLYTHAWEKGLKGMTIYRDGCARSGILTLNDKKEKEKEEEVVENNGLQFGDRKELADDTYYVKKKIVTGCGKLKLFIGWSNSQQCIQDVYAVRSGAGGCEKNIQSICILMSEVFRRGGNIESIEKAFNGVTICPSFIRAKNKGIEVSKGNYCGGAILNAIKEFLNEPERNGLIKGVKQHTIIEVTEKKDKFTPIDLNIRIENKPKLTDEERKFIEENGESAFAQKYNKCPECGVEVQRVGGCIQCPNCSYSKCE